MTTNRPPTLILDARQRALLLEMGVRVWLPSEEKPQTSIAAPVQAPLKTPPEQTPTLVLPVRSEPPLRLPVVTAPVTAAPTRYTIKNLPAMEQAFDWVLVGEPCTGESEKLLANMLKVFSGAVFVAQMVSASKDDSSVQDQIGCLNAKVVLALGPHAAKAVLGTHTDGVPFGKLRSSMHTMPSCTAKVAVTYHPIQLLRHPPAKHQTWIDLKRIMKELA